MAKLFGLLVGVAYSGAAAPKSTSSAHERGTDHVLRRDRIELVAAAVNDTISLAILPSNTVLDPYGCHISFDDLGVTTTLDIGDATYPAALNAAQDVSAAAGTASIVKSVNIDKYFEPVWKQLGYAADPGGKIELLATVKASAASGTLVWGLRGQAR